MSRRPTQADVAKLAGVSRATVSYVLRNLSGGRIPITQETRSKVLTAAKQLGYQPNAVAQGLRSGVSKTIGLLIPDASNPHYLQILNGAEAELTDQGYYLFLVIANLDPEREGRCLRSLFQKRLDGLILVPTFADFFPDEMNALRKRSNPAVFIGVQEGDWVDPDICGATALAMEHLLSLGHKRIGFINGVARPMLAERRLTIYQQKLQEHGLPFDESLIYCCGYHMHDGYVAARVLLDSPNPPTALLSINDHLAIGALRAIRERGLRVPEDISLIGFDNIDIAAELYPPLTTVDLHGEQIGRRAAQMLLAHLHGQVSEPMQALIGTELIARQSTGPAPRA